MAPQMQGMPSKLRCTPSATHCTAWITSLMLVLVYSMPMPRFIGALCIAQLSRYTQVLFC